MDDFYKMVRQHLTLSLSCTTTCIQYFVGGADDIFAVQREPDPRHGWRNWIREDYTVSWRPREILSCPSFLKPYTYRPVSFRR